jgi:pimeloyl-ACP methyl ester carboxylesterase
MTAATAATARTATKRAGAHPPSKLLALTEPTRALGELAAFVALRPLLSFLPRGDGHGVLVLPGFMASDSSTAPMRRLLSQLGYAVAGWELGRNVKVDNARVEAMARCVRTLYERTGGKISIVGWSLGGVFARELAKQMPEMVRQVITLGSPISDNRQFTNARPLFEMINGKKPQPMRSGKFKKLGEAPPVPTTSILTKADGVVHWRGSVQHPGANPQTENIEVYASHIGLGVNPAVMFAIADRLAQSEGEWAPFEAKGCAGFAFPRTTLH